MESAQRLEILNATCACMPIDRFDVERSMVAAAPKVKAALAERPVLFAGTSVFLCEADVSGMQKLISAIERVSNTEQFKSAI